MLFFQLSIFSRKKSSKIRRTTIYLAIRRINSLKLIISPSPHRVLAAKRLIIVQREDETVVSGENPLTNGVLAAKRLIIVQREDETVVSGQITSPRGGREGVSPSSFYFLLIYSTIHWPTSLVPYLAPPSTWISGVRTF